MHDTIVRFMQKAEEGALPEERQWGAWLSRTLCNLFYDQCRRKKVQVRRASDPTLGPAAVETREYVVQSLYERITDEQFAQAIESLSPTQRETVKKHVQGMSNQEIARSLDIPDGTVRKRLHDARTKLREILKKYFPPGGHP